MALKKTTLFERNDSIEIETFEGKVFHRYSGLVIVSMLKKTHQKNKG
jgi:hypothetical protein